MGGRSRRPSGWRRIRPMARRAGKTTLAARGASSTRLRRLSKESGLSARWGKILRWWTAAARSSVAWLPRKSSKRGGGAGCAGWGGGGGEGGGVGEGGRGGSVGG